MFCAYGTALHWAKESEKWWRKGWFPSSSALQPHNLPGARPPSNPHILFPFRFLLLLAYSSISRIYIPAPTLPINGIDRDWDLFGFFKILFLFLCSNRLGGLISTFGWFIALAKRFLFLPPFFFFVQGSLWIFEIWCSEVIFPFLHDENWEPRCTSGGVGIVLFVFFFFLSKQRKCWTLLSEHCHWYQLSVSQMDIVDLRLSFTCSSSIKPAEEGVNKFWGRKAVSFVLITVTGGVALSALDDLAIYHSCSRYLSSCNCLLNFGWIISVKQIWRN